MAFPKVPLQSGVNAFSLSTNRGDVFAPIILNSLLAPICTVHSSRDKTSNRTSNSLTPFNVVDKPSVVSPRHENIADSFGSRLPIRQFYLSNSSSFLPDSITKLKNSISSQSAGYSVE